jgi:hypothetical protein
LHCYTLNLGDDGLWVMSASSCVTLCVEVCDELLPNQHRWTILSMKIVLIECMQWEEPQLERESCHCRKWKKEVRHDDTRLLAFRTLLVIRQVDERLATVRTPGGHSLGCRTITRHEVKA